MRYQHSSSTPLFAHQRCQSTCVNSTRSVHVCQAAALARGLTGMGKPAAVTTTVSMLDALAAANEGAASDAEGALMHRFRVLAVVLILWSAVIHRLLHETPTSVSTMDSPENPASPRPPTGLACRSGAQAGSEPFARQLYAAAQDPVCLAAALVQITVRATHARTHTCTHTHTRFACWSVRTWHLVWRRISVGTNRCIMPACEAASGARVTCAFEALHTR